MLLRGLDEYQRFDRESNAQARETFKNAIVLDASYARAYANVALTYVSEVNFNWTNNREEAIQLGLEYSDRALNLDNNIPQIYLTRSILYLAQRRHDAASRGGPPNNRSTPKLCGWLCRTVFRFKLRRAARRGPRSYLPGKTHQPSVFAYLSGCRGPYTIFIRPITRNQLVVLEEAALNEILCLTEFN